MTRTRRTRPWWVGPGVGALVGAACIAVAAQGSLAAGRVSLPPGPRLKVSQVAPVATAATPAGQPVTVVAPDRPVVTESSAASSSGATGGFGSSGSGGAPSLSGGVAPRPAEVATTTPTGAGGPGDGASGGATGPIEPPADSSTTTVPTQPPTTTQPKHEPGDT